MRIVKIENFGQQLREMREAAGFTQADLAKAAGLSQQHVSAIERAQMLPVVSTLCRLADALELDWSYDGRRIVFRRRTGRRAGIRLDLSRPADRVPPANPKDRENETGKYRTRR